MTEYTDDFDWEFYVGENAQVPDEAKAKARQRMLALAEGHHDVIGASVALERPAVRESAYLYEARVVAFVRPDNVVAVEKADTPEGALKASLDAVERQVRQKREKLRKPWQRPGGAEPQTPPGAE
jgi:hypothetical protein